MLQLVCAHGSADGELAFKINVSQLDQAVANTASCSRKATVGNERGDCYQPPSSARSGWEVTTGFKLLQQSQQDKGAEEEDAASGM